MKEKFKSTKSELPFTISMAHELVRKELQKKFNGEVMFLYCDFLTTKVEKINIENQTWAEKEADQLPASIERYIALNGMVAIDNSPEKVLIITAQIRLFKLDKSLIWEPHYVTLEVLDGNIDKKTFTYLDGIIDGMKFCQNSLNPCPLLLHTQTQQYLRKLEKI